MARRHNAFINGLSYFINSLYERALFWPHTLPDQFIAGISVAKLNGEFLHWPLFFCPVFTADFFRIFVASMQEHEIRGYQWGGSFDVWRYFFIIIIFHCFRLNFRAAATVLSFYGAFTTIKEKKKTAQKYIFIVRRSQGHMQVNFIVIFYETAANCFSFFLFVCFRLLFFTVILWGLHGY